MVGPTEHEAGAEVGALLTAGDPMPRYRRPTDEALDVLGAQFDSYGTGKIPDKEILKIVKETFDFRPGMISINLDLKRSGAQWQVLEDCCLPAYGHFGRESRDDANFTREVVKPLKSHKVLA